MASDDPGEPLDSRPLDDSVHAELVAFVRALRARGAEVPANAGVDAAATLATVGVTEKAQTRAGLRAAVLTRVDDRDLFDRLFEQFWRRLREAAETTDETRSEDEEGFDLSVPESSGESQEVEDARDASERLDSADLVAGDQEGGPGDVYETAEYSPVGASEPVDATVLSDRESTRAAVDRLTRALAAVSGRRTETADSGFRPDVRRALRSSVATGGALTSLPEVQRKQTEVRGVVVADVSRSVLDVIDRGFLVQFLRAVHESWRAAPVFLFDTDVREVTDAVSAETASAAFAALEDAETVWGGGTRIGHALESIRADAPDAVDRRTVVVIVSDGLEMGDLDSLESGMAWVAGRASMVLWLNPLAASGEYEPTAAGMATALPYVDCLYPFTDVEDVTELARDLELYPRQRVGYRTGTGD
jgi:uncharacterized protein with von Willebrand factor type A (vWA) domain